MTDNPSDPGEFGPLLMAAKQNMRPIGVGLGVAAAALFAVAVGVFNEAASQPRPSYGGVLGAAVIGLILSALAVLAWRSGIRETYFYDRGAVDLSKRGRRAVRYEDVAEMRYLMNVRPWELSIVFRLVPEPGGQPREEFVYTGTIMTAGPHGVNWANGDQVRARVEPIVAARFERALSAGQSIPWGKHATLTRAGLAIDGVTHRWADVASAEFDAGSGYIDVFVGGGRRVLHLLHHDWNAWPGLAVAQSRMAQANGGAAAGAAAPRPIA